MKYVIIKTSGTVTSKGRHHAGRLLKLPDAEAHGLIAARAAIDAEDMAEEIQGRAAVANGRPDRVKRAKKLDDEATKKAEAMKEAAKKNKALRPFATAAALEARALKGKHDALKAHPPAAPAHAKKADPEKK